VTKSPPIYAIFKDYGKQESFRCDGCKRVLQKDWTDEEAMDEMKENYGNIDTSDTVILCDDCVVIFNLKTRLDNS
jgi:hypothetical protein